ncbi:hypothetical protein [Streptomyces griseiscabiei]|uniref:Uncharacterized protein n=1 Tax=Streptomyces griseiscabiei TaxID=2993540 RepID=A0ABU4LCB3_9ACTN|nr:hypothetical protein [Streptomyces griseiscabiei]MDX2913367.1 hypothetical protein [Streptomyces griseiscabiei]
MGQAVLGPDGAHGPDVPAAHPQGVVAVEDPLEGGGQPVVRQSGPGGQQQGLGEAGRGAGPFGEAPGHRGPGEFAGRVVLDGRGRRCRRGDGG